MIRFAMVSIIYGTLSVPTTKQNGSVRILIEGLDDGCEVGGMFGDDDNEEISESLESLLTMVLIYVFCRAMSSDA